MSGFTFRHHHADAEKRRKYEHTNAVIRRKRGKNVGRNDSEYTRFSASRALNGTAGADSELEVDAVGRSPDQLADVRYHVFVWRRVVKNQACDDYRRDRDGDNGNEKPDDQRPDNSASRAADHRRTYRQRNSREQKRQDTYAEQRNVEIADRAKIFQERNARGSQH